LQAPLALDSPHRRRRSARDQRFGFVEGEERLFSLAGDETSNATTHRTLDFPLKAISSMSARATIDFG